MQTLEAERTTAQERLLEAAGEVFADLGFHAATIRQITRRAGMNVAAVNYYFRDKQELYEAVLLHAQTCGREPIAASGPPEERIRAFVNGLLRRILDPLRPAWQGKLITRELASPTRAFTRLIEGTFRPRCRVLDAALQELAGDRLPEEARHRIAGSIIGQCIFYRQNRQVTQLLYPSALAGNDPIEALTDHITTFSLAGIRQLLAGAPEKA